MEIDRYIRDEGVIAAVRAFYKRVLYLFHAAPKAEALDSWLTRIIVMGSYTHYNVCLSEESNPRKRMLMASVGHLLESTNAVLAHKAKSGGFVGCFVRFMECAVLWRAQENMRCVYARYKLLDAERTPERVAELVRLHGPRALADYERRLHVHRPCDVRFREVLRPLELVQFSHERLLDPSVRFSDDFMDYEDMGVYRKRQDLRKRHFHVITMLDDLHQFMGRRDFDQHLLSFMQACPFSYARVAFFVCIRSQLFLYALQLEA